MRSAGSAAGTVSAASKPSPDHPAPAAAGTVQPAERSSPAPHRGPGLTKTPASPTPAAARGPARCRGHATARRRVRGNAARLEIAAHDPMDSFCGRG
ncbi:hypothetical protein PSMK_06620 [Phycisphaera mikurensis NBRC 102666]|uniref:Uncharacterized protein n=1 Tax=Phycisphaera mikurensis (strain NBRC 102666 / KCTC 22515 / FYK2301M01) TaxID=1142394 RepID=I0IC33_PHYMF|nr:hypothetical protein PSMK_06620 [Phycisphaera mikurensis NBRC 102666]